MNGMKMHDKTTFVSEHMTVNGQMKTGRTLRTGTGLMT